MQTGHSSGGGGSANSFSSCNSAALLLQSFLCFVQWDLWQVALQYFADLHALHVLRLEPAFPQAAQVSSIRPPTPASQTRKLQTTTKRSAGREHALTWELNLSTRIPFSLPAFPPTTSTTPRSSSSSYPHCCPHVKNHGSPILPPNHHPRGRLGHGICTRVEHPTCLEIVRKFRLRLCRGSGGEYSPDYIGRGEL